MACAVAEARLIVAHPAVGCPLAVATGQQRAGRVKGLPPLERGMGNDMERGMGKDMDVVMVMVMGTRPASRSRRKRRTIWL